MNGFTPPVPAIVIAAEHNEQALIRAARSALTACNWQVGRCAHEWTQRFARGRTDADFGELIGLSGDQVCQRRRVWQVFGETGKCDTYQSLSWSHFYAALTWDDADTCLEWARDMEATVAEMKAWRRAQHGELDVVVDGESREESGAPARVNRNSTPAASNGTERPSGETREPGASPPPAAPSKKRATLSSQAFLDTCPATEANSKATLTSSPDSAEDHSPDVGPVASRPVSASEVIVRLRELLRRAEADLEPGALQEIGEECRGWANKLAPALKIAKTFSPPTLAEVAAYAASRNSSVDPEHWWLHYESKGWMVGRVKMKNWQLAFQRAEREGWANKGQATNAPRGSTAEANARSFSRLSQLQEYVDGDDA